MESDWIMSYHLCFRKSRTCKALEVKDKHCFLALLFCQASLPDQSEARVGELLLCMPYFMPGKNITGS